MRFQVAVLATLAILIADGWRPRQGAAQIRYVANAGMLVTVDQRRFLIDAPIRNGIAPYPTSPPDERTRLEAARSPYDNIDAILVTHWHDDHFSAEAVAAHLNASARTRFVSSPQVVDLVRAVAPGLSDRLRAILPDPGQSAEIRVGNVPVRVLRIRHNQSRRFPEQHVGFLIGDSTTVLHVGDADPKADNFAVLRTLPKIDIALLPFWYAMNDENRRFVSESIAPRRIVAMHLPDDEAAALANSIRDASMAIALPRDPGSAIVLEK
jgi:L-ascorbate metabolism protein UlaG (beta-lactamase superfamily)